MTLNAQQRQILAENERFNASQRMRAVAAANRSLTMTVEEQEQSEQFVHALCDRLRVSRTASADEILAALDQNLAAPAKTTPTADDAIWDELFEAPAQKMSTEDEENYSALFGGEA